MVNDLGRFRIWTENPRVGGSIPPLATIQIMNFLRLAIGRCRGNPLVVPYLCRDFPCCRQTSPNAPRRGAHNAAASSRFPIPRAPVTRRAVSRPVRASSPTCSPDHASESPRYRLAAAARSATEMRLGKFNWPIVGSITGALTGVMTFTAALCLVASDIRALIASAGGGRRNDFHEARVWQRGVRTGH